jgi:SAM-dependent methyltransferase
MQERLTTEQDWRWNQKRRQFSAAKIGRLGSEPNFWTSVARSFYRPEYKTFIELGCAPGNVSALLTIDTDLMVYGVDFSEDSETYLEAMRRIGKEGTLYKEDVFSFSPKMVFDVVCSCGLIEHFRGAALYELLRKHDDLVAPGGLLIIQVPNFTGLHYLWHYVLDKPQLDVHNVDSMQPGTFSMFREIGYETLFCDYQGQLQVWGVSSFNRDGRYTPLSYMVGGLNFAITNLSKLVGKAGLKLQGQTLSPWFLFVARKPA